MADIAASPERLLVCVGPSPHAGDLIRAAAQMAASGQNEWFAVYVETPRMLRLPEAERNRAVYHLRLAEQMGAETVTLRGQSAAREILEFARRRQITRIIAGKPGRGRWQYFPGLSPVEELVRLGGEIEVLVTAGAPGEEQEAALPVTPKSLRLAGYETSLLYLVLATGLSFLMYPYFDLPNLIMVYLLAVLVTAIQCGRGPAILNSLLCVLAFDFCFVPPRWSFTVDEAKYIVTFGVMFLVAVVISHLAAVVRRQAEAARLHERQTAAMYALSRQLAAARGVDKVLQAAVQQIAQIFDCQAVALLPDENGKLRPVEGDLAAVFQKDLLKELAVAQGAYDSGSPAGWGTRTAAASPILYVPLAGAGGALGVVALRPRDPESEQWLLPEQLRLPLLESLAKQTALALEVEKLQKSAMEAQIAMESEHLRSALLGSITHDFQTPLAAIMGSASSLQDFPQQIEPGAAREMLANIYHEAERLSLLVGNILDIAKLESGSFKLRRELQPLEEVVGAALNRLEKKLADRPLTTALPADLPMLPLDGALAEHIFLNLLENALKYTPPGSPLKIAAVQQGEEVEVEVGDCGPGFAQDDLPRIFEMFYRGAGGRERQGYGLGLAVCRAIVEAHGGRIWAENREGGGAVIRFTLPLQAKEE